MFVHQQDPSANIVNIYVQKQAEKEQLLTFEIHIDEKDNPRIKSYLSEVLHLYHRVSMMFFPNKITREAGCCH